MADLGTASDFAHAISTLAQTIYAHQTVDETVQRIAETTCDYVPGFDQVGVSILSGSVVVTQAFAGTLAPRLDEIQYGLWEGPCVDVLSGTDVVTAPSLRHEQRWTRYVPQVVALGVKSQLALRLHHNNHTIGSLTLYSTASDEVTTYAEVLARLFATHSSAALRHAQERAEFAHALQSRTVIGVAIGILMERYDLSQDRALEFLRRTSSQSNIKLRVVAQELVDTRGNRGATR